jgi:hypothetical protein
MERDLQEIYKVIEDEANLCDEHQKEQYDRPAIHHQVRSTITNKQSGMIHNKGYLQETCIRGRYAITEKGKMELSMMLQKAEKKEQEGSVKDR